jgi:tetrahydromethanopterin S-methyltransferase subunit C
VVGGCALSAAGDLYTRAQSRWSMAILVITTMLGIVALTAAVTGLITGSTLALAVLVTATIALWLTATIRHAFTAPAGPVNMRDVHEVIDPKRPAYH